MKNTGEKDNYSKVINHNQKAWDYQARSGCRWSTPVNTGEIEKARLGNPNIYLSPNLMIDQKDYLSMKEKKVLLLAGGGGQQSAILSAFGAQVFVFDLSNEQLKRDQETCQKFGLSCEIQQGDAADLSSFEDESFDFIINPVSNCFFPKLQQVWKECYRVLRSKGKIFYAFVNPISYIFDFEKANHGEYLVRYSLPYSDQDSLSDSEKKKFLANENALEFGHTLEQQIGELLRCGFMVESFREDNCPELYESAKYFCNFIAVSAVKI